MQRKYILFIISALLFASCTKVIDVDLNDASPMIVVDASVNSYDNVLYTDQNVWVKVSWSSSYFENNTPTPIDDASLAVINANGDRFDLVHNTSGGYYASIPADKRSNEWKLEGLIEGKEFKSNTQIPNYVAIDSILAAKLPFGPPKDGLTPIVFFTDIAGEENYYRMKIWINDTLQNKLYITRDDGFDGKQIAYPFMRLQLKTNDKFRVELLCIDKFSLDYYKVFAMNTGGGGFSAAPGNPLSNIDGEGMIGIFTGQTSSWTTRIVGQ